MLLGRVAADEAEVLTLAVAPAVRRRGIATALLRAAGPRSRARGGAACSSRWPPATPRRRRSTARCGFVEVGRRRRYYADASDALVLR